MKDISQSTALVFDHGLFISTARCLAQKFKRVLYHSPYESAYVTLNDCVLGDGFGDIERVDDYWEIKNEVDVWVFPDIQHAGLQVELESQGRAVWGPRKADSLEINRQKFLRVLAEIGLKVPPHHVIRGLTNLRLFLKDKEEKFIKVTKYRGTIETRRWRSDDLDSGWLDELAVKLGPTQDKFTFLVFDDIDAPVEVGGDTICVDGKFPNLMLHADEFKDKSWIGTVTKREDMPEILQDVMNAFAPVFSAERFRSQFSMETRGDYFIDPTCRGGLPSTGTQLNLWKNFPEIVHAGAHGELVEPEAKNPFAVECVLSIKGEEGSWWKTRIPEELEPFAKFQWCCEVDGAICFPPNESRSPEIGWLVTGGETIKAAIEEMHELVKQLPAGLDAGTDSLFGLLKQIKEGEEQGVEFGDKPVPEPVVALDA